MFKKNPLQIKDKVKELLRDKKKEFEFIFVFILIQRYFSIVSTIGQLAFICIFMFRIPFGHIKYPCGLSEISQNVSLVCANSIFSIA